VSAVDTGHRSGCAFGRTARCTCTYLAQWDKRPAYTAPAFVPRDIEGNPLMDPDYEQEFHDEQLRSRYWHKEYLEARRQYWWMLAFAGINGVCFAGAVWQLVNR
jgi:hypothetical protein